MSSASKGRYQSRLFNFFHKQSRRFGEGFGRSLRQLQVATSWSIEALSQSIYLLLQKAADSAGTQLPGATEESKLQLQPSAPSADSAIARVLENVETQDILSLHDSQLSISPIPQTEYPNQQSLQDVQLSKQKIQIQGVASQINSQNLVLVTSENEILDVLTPMQQQALENQIITEIANYWRSWRLSQVKQEKLLSIEGFFEKRSLGNGDRTKALPSENAVVKSEDNYLQINPTVASLDTAIANLETNAFTPVSRVQIIVKQRGGEVIKVVKTKLDIFLYGDRQATVSGEDIVADSNLETQSKIKGLIWAALNYFYGESRSKKNQQTPPKRHLSSTKPKSPQLQSQQSENWLSNADLFGNGFPQLNPPNQALNKLETSKKQLNRSTEDNSSQIFGLKIPNWRTLRLKEKAGLQQSRKGALKNQQDGIKPSERDGYIKPSERNSYIKPSERDSYIKPSERDSYIKPSEQDGYIKSSERDSYIKPSERDSYIKPSERDSYIKPSKQDARTTSGISQKITINPGSELESGSKKIAQTRESTEIEAKPEWIETKAELVGYQKHPLERMLAWIDNTMLKIEEAIVNFANALQQLWRK
ncbi:MAG: hypothetical protein WBA41_02320 [Rivularia sp. (in: cyanobacteria)]